MTRPISTRTHGMIDYAWATTAAALPERLPEAPVTGRLVRRAGIAASISSAMTNYEAGLVRVMPMKGHLTVDYLMCSALIASPLFLPSAERRYAIVPVALGALGLLTSLLTETRSPLEGGEQFRPNYQLSEAVHDPDIDRTPTLRAHLE
jgi:hypothetical protein